ncbi:MAG: DUF120 domain-containing protein [Candidatus Bathyarchaeia archaeon]
MRKTRKIVCVKGKVVSGIGKGAKFIELPWVRRQINEKLGFTPYAGTLNIMLNEEYINARKIIEKATPIIIVPEPEYCRGKCFRAFIMNSAEGAVIIPEVEDYPENILEVIASVNLRNKFKLEDGDLVKVSVILE